MLLVGITLTVAVLAFIVAIYIFVRLKRVRGIWQVGLLFLLEFIYALGYALEMATNDLETKIAFNHLQYFAIPFIAITWVYVLQKFNDSNYVGKWIHYLPFLVIPIITFISVQITYYTGFDWYYRTAQLETVNFIGGSQIIVLTLTKGPLYYLHIGQSTLLTAYVVYVYGKTFLTSKGIHKSQALILSICAIIGTVASAISFFSTRTSGIDLTLYMLVIISHIIIYTMFKYELFDLEPAAHQTAFERNNTAIIILDDKYEVVSWNQAADELPVISGLISYHDRIDNLFANKELIQAIHDRVSFSFKTGKRHYVLEAISLLRKTKHVKGVFLKFNEITSYIERIEALDYQASHDELTKLLNRRSFHEQAQHFLEDEETSGKPFSLVMIDLDDFKNVNDTYGHPIGDYVLRDLADLISGLLPDQSLFCRYGGEEFLIMFLDTAPNASRITSETIRQAVSDRHFTYGDILIRINISLGIYNYHPGDHGNVYDYVKLADEALYVSKRTGKNKVSVFIDSAEAAKEMN